MTTETQMNITSTLTLTQLNELIAKVAAAERITKEGLSTLSRELLAHVYVTGDVTPINTLLGSDENGKFLLTPLNWRVAVQYFTEYVAFTSNYEKEVMKFAVHGEGKRVSLVFNKKSKQKFNLMLPKVEAWLAVESNDLWSWSAAIKMDGGVVDYFKPIIQNIEKALDEEKGNLSIMAVLAHIIDNTGIQLTDLAQFTSNPMSAEDALQAHMMDLDEPVQQAS